MRFRLGKDSHWVNVICPKEWLLGRMGEELAHRIPKIHLNHRSRDSFRINYFINYQGFDRRPNSVVGAYFTHVEENVESLRRKFFDVAAQVDFRVCHALRYVESLSQAGFTAVQIPPGVNLEIFRPRLILGVAGRFYDYSRRKGEALLARISELDFVELRFTHGKLRNQREVADFYRNLDYTLVASQYEGGPMSVAESLACGVPVISPHELGWVSEFREGIFHYQPSNFESLRALLIQLNEKKWGLRKQVQSLTWDRFAQAHRELFESHSHSGLIPDPPRETAPPL